MLEPWTSNTRAIQARVYIAPSMAFLLPGEAVASPGFSAGTPTARHRIGDPRGYTGRSLRGRKMLIDRMSLQTTHRRPCAPRALPGRAASQEARPCCRPEIQRWLFVGTYHYSTRRQACQIIPANFPSLGSSGSCVLSDRAVPTNRGRYPRPPGILRLSPAAWSRSRATPPERRHRPCH